MLGMVCIKRVVDYAVKIRVSKDTQGIKNIDLNGIKMSMNPFCEIAVEEGIRLKEKNIINKLIAVSIGPDKAQETLRHALAMGVDRAILLKTDMRIDSELQPLAVAKLLKWTVLKEQPKLVLMGKQAIDDDFNQTPQILAGLLDWPQATQASKIEFEKDSQDLFIEREVDNGLQTVKVSLPSIISCDLRMNTPRYASLPNLMKAKKKQLDIIDVTQLGIDIKPRLQVLSIDEPPQRKSGLIVSSVDELLDKLRNVEKINI